MRSSSSEAEEHGTYTDPLERNSFPLDSLDQGLASRLWNPGREGLTSRAFGWRLPPET